MMKQELEQHRQEVLRKISEIRTMRRGSVSEQFLEVRHKGEPEPVKRGPYYLWQYWEHGVPKRKRLRSGPEVETARKEVAAYKEFEQLCAQYVVVAEALAKAEREAFVSDEIVKKGLKPRPSGTRKSRG